MNMLHLSVRQGSEKARIWQICDELLAKNGTPPSGREVADIYMAEGGNQGTGFTQYSHWKKEYLARQEKDMQRDLPSLSPGNITFRSMSVATDGSITLPADLRRAMLLDDDGRVTVSVIDGELRVISPMVAVRQLQRRTRDLVPAGTLVSDELIAERRKEAEAQ
ncbi:hypothetical protein [Pararhizobium sp. LjRoot238]|uniref:hypothetical protein n=1 Tax=Pararhizobium sp. LjRoot238 TaxID=3342293 RepID=UPI003ECD1EA4